MPERVESESFGLLCPELMNTLEGSQASETPEAPPAIKLNGLDGDGAMGASLPREFDGVLCLCRDRYFRRSGREPGRLKHVRQDIGVLLP